MAPQACVFASKVQQLLAVVEASGFALQQEGKPVGGLAVSRPYLECALLAEGRRLDRDAAKAAASADLLFCSSVASPSSSGLGVVGCAPCPLTPVSEDDDSTNAVLPRDLGPALLKVLGPQAVAELRWGRVPSVALLARGAIPEAALAAAALAGVPVSPSLAGPHEEEVPTVVEVFLKAGGNGGNGSSASHNNQQQQRYPEARLLLLRDGGFLALGADIDEAAAAFARAARAKLLGEGAYAAVSEACGLQPSAAPSASGVNNKEASAAGVNNTNNNNQQQQQQHQSQVPTLDAFEGLGSGALLLSGPGVVAATGGGAGAIGSHPLLMLGSGGGLPHHHHHANGNGNPGDTARAVPLFSLGGAATALRRLGHSLLGGRPTVGGRASDGAAEIISLGDTGGGAAGGNGGTARAGALRPSLPGVRGLFAGSAGTNASPFAALPQAGPPSAAGLPPAGPGTSNGGRKASQQGSMALAMMLGSTGLARKGSETAPAASAQRGGSGLPSFTSGGLKPW